MQTSLHRILEPQGRAAYNAQPALLVGRGTLLWWIAGTPLLLFFLLPLLAVVSRTTPDGLTLGFSEPAVRSAIWISLKTSTIATMLVMVFGTPLAYILARGRGYFRRWADVLVDLPMVLPPAVAGLALLVTFGRRGLLGEPLSFLGLEIAFTQVAVVLAQVFVAGPLYVRAATIGFSQADRELIEAATLDGAGHWQTAWHIVLPLARPALLNGMVLTWTRALGEFGATILFAGNLPGRTQTMPLAIYLGFEADLTVALTLSVLLIACSVVAIVLTRRVLL